MQPFEVNVPDETINALKSKIGAATYFNEVDFANDWTYGVPLKDVKRLAKYWANGFDWRSQEQKINRLPQFTTSVQVDGFGVLNIHAVQKKSDNPNSVPLLFVHGWPGSFLEVEKLLPLLTNPKGGVSFHVVAPSLPNFGFSDGVKSPGFGLPQYAEALHKVMLNLGYNRYVTQGGDWGFKVTRFIGIRYPDNCLASHLNLVLANPPTLKKWPLKNIRNKLRGYTEQEQRGLERTAWFQEQGMGYNILQSTKPTTIGFALADSPIALLAWIYEKLHDWTDEYPWTDDEILTWVSLYWFSNAGPAASARIYFEAQHPINLEVSNRTLDYQSTILGLSYFPRDISVVPSSWGRTLGPVVFEARHKSGGHFAAYERPEELANDLQKMFGSDGGAKHITKKLLS